MADADVMKLETTCVIAGGGPAGMMAGFLLARAGVDVIVLEKHKDFLRDFRGDTIHPSTLELMWELGILERFLARPHEEVREVRADFGAESLRIGDFSRLPTHCKFIAFMPQWEFLDFIAEEARRYPGFRLMMEAEAVDLVRDADRVAGVRIRTNEGEAEIRSGLTIAADGRRSCLRDAAALPRREIGAPFDVVWLRLPWRESDPKEPVGRTGAGAILVMIYRGDYWQCALVIPKGGFEALREKGIAALQGQLAGLAGFAADRVDTIASFDDVSLLTVKMDRLERWARPGLLAIGDAAHAMSPVGGVGINLAIQDAVAAANILTPILLRNEVPALSALEKVQRRREWPTRITQGFQSLVQSRAVAPLLKGGGPPRSPAIFRILNSWPWLRQFPARFLGLGVRPEHIHTPDCLAERN
jgi:2-polyprenyl-6-methoxyphenol hydroxylase-like FAD-dependent oxidoreductase